MRIILMAIMLAAIPATAQIFPARIRDKGTMDNFEFLWKQILKINAGGAVVGTYIPLTASFGGDVSGTYGAIVVGNDSHSHTASTLPSFISSTATIVQDITDLKTSTGTIDDDLQAFKEIVRISTETTNLSTGTINADLQAYKTIVQLSTASIADSTGAINSDLQAYKTTVQLSTASIADSTGTINSDFQDYKETVRISTDTFAISTGTLVKKSGDTMTGQLTLNGGNLFSNSDDFITYYGDVLAEMGYIKGGYIFSHNWINSESSITAVNFYGNFIGNASSATYAITSSSSSYAPGDNLGNHIATTTLQLNSQWLSNDGGAEGIRVDNDGEVGIGIAVPTSLLHVYGGDGVTFKVQDAGFDIETIGMTVNYPSEGESQIWTSVYNDLVFSVGNPAIEDVRITGAGKVGINNSNPQALLHISSGAIYNDLQGAGIYTTGSSTAAYFYGSGANLTNLSTVTYKADEVSLHESGGVFSAIASSVTLQGPIVSSVAVNSITNSAIVSMSSNKVLAGALNSVTSLTASSATITGNSGAYGLTVSSGVDLAGLIYTNNGNVGIGTTGPGAKLDVMGTSGTYPTMQIAHSANGVEGEFLRIARTDSPTIRYQSLIGNHSSIPANSYIAFKLHDGVTTTSQVEVMRLTGAGNVGIGTTNPSTKMDISSGTITMSGTGAPAAGGALCLNASKAMSKCTSVVDASGNCTCP